MDGAEKYGCFAPWGDPDLQTMVEHAILTEDIGAGEKKEISDILMYIGMDLEKYEIKEVEKISLQVGVFATEGQEFLFSTESVEIPVQ